MDVDLTHLDLPHRVRVWDDGKLLPQDGDEEGAERFVVLNLVFSRAQETRPIFVIFNVHENDWQWGSNLGRHCRMQMC